MNDGLQAGLRDARLKRRRVIEPKPNEIQIDIDSPNQLDVFARQRAMLMRRGLAQKWKWKIAVSSTPGHVHITARMPYARPLRERVLLAALLGSDLKREMFNYVRVVNRRRYPVVFFEKPRKKRGMKRAK